MSPIVMSKVNRRRVIAGLTGALLACAPVATAIGRVPDPRSPDARDAAALAQRANSTPTRTDLRSPDAVDAAVRAISHRGDAGYAGLNTAAPQLPGSSAVAAVAPTARTVHTGPAWGYVALMVALALLAGMGLNETLRRHRLGRLLTPRV